MQRSHAAAAAILFSAVACASEKTSWELLAPRSADATGDVKLTVQKDRSVLARSPRPRPTAYTITAEPTLRRIAAVRLEVLPDKSLPGGGPGRAHHGNFILTRFEAHIVAADGTVSPVAFTSVSSTPVDE